MSGMAAVLEVHITLIHGQTCKRNNLVTCRPYSTTALSATMFCSSPEAPHHLCFKIFNCSVRNAVLKLMHYLSF